MDHSSSPIRSSSSQSPRLRETGSTTPRDVTATKRNHGIFHAAMHRLTTSARSTIPRTTSRVAGPTATPPTRARRPPPRVPRHPPPSKGTAARASRGTWASTRTSWSLRVPTPARCTRSPGTARAHQRATPAARRRRTALCAGVAPASSSAAIARAEVSVSRQPARGVGCCRSGAMATQNDRLRRRLAPEAMNEAVALPHDAPGPRHRHRAAAGPRRQRQHPLDVLRGRRSRALPAQPRADDPPRERHRLRRDGHVQRIPRDRGPHRAPRASAVEEASSSRSRVARAATCSPRRGLNSVSEPGHEQPTHAVARMARGRRSSDRRSPRARAARDGVGRRPA